MPSTGDGDAVTPGPEQAPVTLDVVAAAAGVTPPEGAERVLVGGATHDSSAVRPGDLFAALPGARHHGARFAADAVGRGAVAVLTDPAGAEAARGTGAPVLVVPDPRAVLGEVAATVHGRPADALRLIGVTGTNGKTTTAHLVHAALVLDDPGAGLVGTTGTRVGDVEVPSARTTPEATDLHALLARVVAGGGRSVVMEASSIAVVMHRVDGLVLDVVGFTNLSQDHLDFHRDMDDYLAAKAELFTPRHARRGVVMVDDEAGRAVAAGATVDVRTASITGPADWTVSGVEPDGTGGTRFRVHAPDGSSAPVHVRLPGRFNVANALLAVALLVESGTPLARAVEGVASCPGVPGRMERVDAGQEFLAVVDYAHTPGAVSRLLADLRESVPAAGARVLTVLGCGGDRDAAKRPLMGEAAARGSALLVVTDDNPRSEDPARIRAEVLAGALAVPEGERGEVVEVADRAEAIRTAVRRARAQDVVVVAGKGHEQGQEVAGRVTPFDDRVVLRAALQEVGPT